MPPRCIKSEKTLSTERPHWLFWGSVGLPPVVPSQAKKQNFWGGPALSPRVFFGFGGPPPFCGKRPIGKRPNSTSALPPFFPFFFFFFFRKTEVAPFRDFIGNSGCFFPEENFLLKPFPCKSGKQTGGRLFSLPLGGCVWLFCLSIGKTANSVGGFPPWSRGVFFFPPGIRRPIKRKPVFSRKKSPGPPGPS